MLSVELLVDPRTEAALRAEWDALAAAGLPHAGRNPSPTNRPHVTLAVRDRLVAEDFAHLAHELPIPLTVGGALLFGHRERFVLSRQVLVSARLLELHRAVSRLAGPAEPRHGITAVDRWTPHLTLARRLDAAQVVAALSVLELTTHEGAAVGLRVWDATTKTVTTLR